MDADERIKVLTVADEIEWALVHEPRQSSLGMFADASNWVERLREICSKKVPSDGR